MGPRSKNFVFNFVLKFRRVTHFWLCLLETQVWVDEGKCRTILYSLCSKKNTCKTSKKVHLTGYLTELSKLNLPPNLNSSIRWQWPCTSPSWEEMSSSWWPVTTWPGPGATSGEIRGNQGKSGEIRRFSISVQGGKSPLCWGGSGGTLGCPGCLQPHHHHLW